MRNIQLEKEAVYMTTDENIISKFGEVQGPEIIKDKFGFKFHKYLWYDTFVKCGCPKLCRIW